MNVLEKILEELEKRVNFRKKLVRYEKKMGTITDVARNQGALEELVVIANIIDSYVNKVNDDWIPCSERLPNKDMDSHLVWITYGSCGNLSTKIAYCEWVLSQDENGADDSYNRFRIEQSPEAYYPSANLVHAWKPMKIPEPYRATDKPDWKENMIDTFLVGH